ncbi:MAG: peptidylprolyl isomerase [Bacteroidota bacterium]|nr:peptidylprolyl isomerase [Bacteroidota bacterium]MDP4216164.1 peptidylprolyl isomerase [Bacteroidota bacterium]MDP4246463.1 peptidylprolyl isomerase [Bacteroidota bacterium]MDP4255224.1 peptidylprolyl isomerase [Bacteroidota bacterium]MDP4258344.1 peptidylprolyl isomerase [Bacteroidota bacterium]
MIRPILRLIPALLILAASCNPRLSNGLRKKDRSRDVEMITSMGTVVLRLSDSTPMHRDNFLMLVKRGYYDSLLFHRVIRGFMIQSGDPDSKEGHPGKPLSQGGSGGPGYTVPAEFRPGLFHKRGALAAARTGDDVNPTKASSGSQFYIVQGRQFAEAGLDSIETFRLRGRKIPQDQRAVYASIGGAPHLDQNYTVFGEVVSGMEVVDSIAAVPTSGRPLDRPLKEVRILKMKLVKRK